MNGKYSAYSLALLASVHIASAAVTIVERGLSYDDALLVPQKSIVSSRQHVLTKTRLTKNIEINIPLVSANMDTVTESQMAIAMAQLGGIGIIHRYNTPEQQVQEVEKVKRYRNAIIENPLTITGDATIAQARELMHAHSIKGLLVIDDEGKLIGILTWRDIRFRPAQTKRVSELMTPRERLIVGKVGITINQAKKLLMKHGIEKLPIIRDDWSVAGLITGKDIYNKVEFPSTCLDKRGRLRVGAAIGVKDDSLERAAALIEAGVDVLVIDIAHGHSDLAINIIKQVKAQFPHIDIIAGNVATAQGTQELIQAGADAIKVGIGPGSICTTRITTGSGYPQLSAVINCAQIAMQYDVPIIADGGIRYSGDITKAIAAGASCVMLGSLLAGTDESPGIPFIKNGKKYKVIRGMAGLGANLGRKDKNLKNPQGFVEGIEALKPYKGTLTETINQLMGGLRSGLSYCGVNTVKNLCGNGTFVVISPAGMKESHPHDVEQVV